MSTGDKLREALRDMLDGWKYIRRSHGDLYGVGWDRAQTKAEEALAADDAARGTMREEFEAWCVRNGYPTDYTPGAECGVEGGPVYRDTRTHAAWWAYREGQASRAAAPIDPTDPGHDVEVLREHVRHLERRVRQLAAAPQSAEPVAWGQLGMLNGRSYLRQNYDRTPYPPPPDVARNLNLIPLFAAPPVAPTEADRAARKRPEAEVAEIMGAVDRYARSLARPNEHADLAEAARAEVERRVCGEKS